jgi:hypothetical protein
LCGDRDLVGERDVRRCSDVTVCGRNTIVLRLGSDAAEGDGCD